MRVLIHMARRQCPRGQTRGNGGWTPLFHAMYAARPMVAEIVDCPEMAPTGMRASLRKPTPEVETPARRYGGRLRRRFIYTDLVNHDALQRVMAAGAK